METKLIDVFGDQTLMDSLTGVELQFTENIDHDRLSADFQTGEKSGLWLIKTESSPIHRWRGVDMKNNWILILIGISEDWGYITIPTANIQNIDEKKLRDIYCDIGKRIGATSITFNGVYL